MRAPLSLVALAMLATLGTGCFTTAGAAIGSRHAKAPAPDDDPDDESPGTHATHGAMIGLGLDVIVLSLLATSFRDHYFEDSNVFSR